MQPGTVDVVVLPPVRVEGWTQRDLVRRIGVASVLEKHHRVQVLDEALRPLGASPHFALDGSEEPEIAGIYIIDDDGLDKRRTQTGDGFGSEWAYYGNLKCEEPSVNSVIKLPVVR